MTAQHVDNCDCQFTRKDYATADGIKNLATYEIYYRCLSNGVTPGTGTMWKVRYESDPTVEEIRQREMKERISKFATSDPEVARERELAGWGKKEK
jgi:hypothetical protein